MVTEGLAIHEPLSANEPPVPLPEQESALLVNQVRVDEPPGAMVLGVVLKLTWTEPSAWTALGTKSISEMSTTFALIFMT